MPDHSKIIEADEAYQNEYSRVFNEAVSRGVSLAEAERIAGVSGIKAAARKEMLDE